MQFADLSTTSECLFSLINGDDMYATYRDMKRMPYGLQIFSKFYLYLFIALFIYVVLSVFIGLVTVTYETLAVSTLLLPVIGVCYCIMYQYDACVCKRFKDAVLFS